MAFIAFLLVLNDLGEFIWGWPDYEFGVDADSTNNMNVNVDLVVNMPCQCEFSFLLVIYLAFGHCSEVLCRMVAFDMGQGIKKNISAVTQAVREPTVLK